MDIRRGALRILVLRHPGFPSITLLVKPFRTLVDRADREWKKTRHGLRSFPDMAARLLEDFEYDWTLERLDQELARWFLSVRRLPEQVSLHNTFGQPPVTLFNNGSLVVDLYLWVAADTSVHSHGFRGAFRVLHGVSLQETYAVKVTRRIAPGVMRCDPGVPRMAILEAGDVRPILPGEQLTHRVIHLESPTVTLCVKTINEPGLHQWEYHPDGLAVQRHDLDADLIKALYYFEYLLKQNASRAARFLQATVGGLSVVMRMTLHESLCTGGLDLGEDAVEQCLAQIRKLHGKSDWFRRHETPEPAHLRELQFAGCESPLDRLAAHFINGGHDRETMAPHLSRVAGRDLTRRDAENVMGSLLDFEFIFGCALSPEDRSTIRDLVLRPKERIPRHLEPFGQIRRMRKFVRMFD